MTHKLVEPGDDARAQLSSECSVHEHGIQGWERAVALVNMAEVEDNRRGSSGLARSRGL
jgi:hypothetical protein